MHFMRTLISLLVVLSLSIVLPAGLALPALHAPAWAATAAAAPSGGYVRQARKTKKKRPRPLKAKTATKKPEKTKKNDRGFEL